MSLMLREPSQIMHRFQDEFNNFFRNFGERTSIFNDEDSSVITSQWIPTVDIVEDENEFIISADIPGVKTKDIEVSMNDGILSIKGERQTEKNEERNGYYRSECCHGKFHRRFSLPDSADPEKIVAKGKDGVLKITLGKREISKPKLIQIQS